LLQAPTCAGESDCRFWTCIESCIESSLSMYFTDVTYILHLYTASLTIQSVAEDMPIHV